MPERVLRILQSLREQTTAVELAEVLWLAQRVPEGENAPLARELLRGSGDATPPSQDAGADTAPGAVLPPSPHEEEAPSELHAAAEQPESGTGPDDADVSDVDDSDADDSDVPPDGSTPQADADAEGDLSEAPTAPEPPRALALRISHPRSLPGLLVTARALRPLKRYRPNPRRQEIDEAATADRIAHTGLLDVVTRPERERWLDLALVVDDSGSMLLWQQLCTELHALFVQLGAFRQVRTWGLRLRNGRAPLLSPRPFGASPSLVPTAVVDDPSGRTMTVVISDGAGPGWRTGAMEAQLTRWASLGPTAIIHALPARMWRGSALPVRRWSVHVPQPGAANGEWRIRDPLLPPEISPFTGIAVPVLEPAPRELAAWARMTVAGGTSTALPLWDPRADREHTAPEPLSGDQAVRQFRRTASPEAYRLAAHLAAIAPLTVPVMRLVAEAVPWSATTAHLSEVFLGGLMRHAEQTAPDGAAPVGSRSFRHSQRVFSFAEEARDVLLDAVPTAEVVETARQVSELIGELMGQSPEFTAWLNRPDGTDLLPEHAQNFAWLGSALLQRLGLTDTAGQDWDEPPPVPEEEPRRTSRLSYLHAPYVGYSTSPRSGWFTWQRLQARDPQTVGGYRLLGGAPGSGPTSVYFGRSPDGDAAAVRHGNPYVEGAAEDLSDLVHMEAAALSRFDHTCLPVLFDYEPDTAQPWTVVSPVITSAGSRVPHLADVVAETGPLGVEAALSLGQRLASALAHSHRAGVVHGRLTPGRILITGDNPVITGWHRATVDGRPPHAGATPAQPTDDLRALAAILAYAANGNEGLSRPYRWSAETLVGFDEVAWSTATLSWPVDAALQVVVARCLRGPADAAPTAVGVLALLRDRLPRQNGDFAALRDWLSPAALALVGDAEHLRTPPQGPVRWEPVGAQVPVTPEQLPTVEETPRDAGDHRKWLRLPGDPPPPRGRRARVPVPKVLGPRPDGQTGHCVVVISPHQGSGRSTVAVQLASALAARASAARGVRDPVVMLPVDRRLGVVGYRLRDPDATTVTARFAADAGQPQPQPDRWVTLADSRGAHFLYGLVSADGVSRRDVWTCRRRVDWLRSFGTVVVDAAGTFLPPEESLRGLLGDVDHVVVTATGREEHLGAVQGQLDWLSGHGYRQLADTATVALSDVDGAAGGGGVLGVAELLGRRAGQVRTIPYDAALHCGGLVDHAHLDKATRRAYDELGSAVGADLDSARPLGRRRGR